jgi:hypothetical protein
MLGPDEVVKNKASWEGRGSAEEAKRVGIIIKTFVIRKSFSVI